MRNKLFLLGGYFLLTPLFVLTLVFYQTYLYNQNSANTARILGTNVSKVEYKAIPQVKDSSEYVVSSREARVDVLREFLGRYNSPLEEHAEEMVAAADKYGLDYRLLPAIAMQESTLCLKAPEGLNNCWGFGIYGTKRTAFANYSAAIETVSKALSEDYHGIGLVEPIDIMSKYTPSNEGEWAENVSYVMDRIASSL